MKKLTIYLAGKVSKNSSFTSHNWRDEFCDRLAELSGRKLTHLDPIASENKQQKPEEIFSKDLKLIKSSNLVVVYLSDDISVGGSQEILIAKYFEKLVIGYAPYGGKFNGCVKKIGSEVISNYKDPFVFSTCDVVCGDLNELAEAIRHFENIDVKKFIDIIK